MKQRFANINFRLRNSSLFRDSFWSLFGNAVGKGFALVAGIVVARFLGSADYGAYGMIKGTLLSIAIFSSFGLGYTATKFIAECRHTNLHRVKQIHRVNLAITFCSSCLIAIIVALFAEPIATWLNDTSLTYLLRWSSIAIVFNAIITTQIGELSGFRAYKIIARNNIISGVLTFICVAPAAYFGGLRMSIVALVFTLFCNCLINAYSLRKLIPKKVVTTADEPTQSLYREILSFSLPIALQESLYSITSWLGMAMLIKLSDYTQLGLSSAASQWMAVMLFIPGALRNVALSHFAENSKNEAASTLILKRLLLVNFISTFIPFCVIAAFSGVIASFYGKSFSELPLVLNISIFTAVVSSMSNVLTQDLIAHNHNWYLFWTRLFRDTMILMLSYIIITQFTPINAASGFAGASLVMQTAYLILLFIKRYHSQSRHLNEHKKTIHL